MASAPDKIWPLADFMEKWKDLVQNDDISLSPSPEMLRVFKEDRFAMM